MQALPLINGIKAHRFSHKTLIKENFLPLRQIDTPCTIDHLTGDHLSHSIDLVTTLRSELAALTYKRDRLMNEVTDTKGALCAKENECETLRAQGARQSALIISLQQRLQATEAREKNLHVGLLTKFC